MQKNKKFYQIWMRIPQGLRYKLSSAMRLLRVRGFLLNLAGLRRHDEFSTPTPETSIALKKCFEKCLEFGLEGDYYEFGIYRGYTFWTAQQLARQLNLRQMRFFGFDSFEGLPEPDKNEKDEFLKGEYSCSREYVEGNLDNHGVDWARTNLIEGYFSESLKPEIKTKLSMKPAAVILVNCDLYSSTNDVLGFVEDLLQDKTIIMFDDWNCFEASDDKGERRAFKEFLDSHPDWSVETFVSFGWHGQSFILNKAG